MTFNTSTYFEGSMIFAANAATTNITAMNTGVCGAQGCTSTVWADVYGSGTATAGLKGIKAITGIDETKYVSTSHTAYGDFDMIRHDMYGSLAGSTDAPSSNK